MRSGSFRGAYYDFSQEAGAKGRSVPQSAAEGVSAGPRKERKAGAELPSAAQGAEPAAQPAKRRGRPAKAKEEGAEPAAQPAATGEAQPAKRRGRPPKAKAPEQNGDGEENV